MQSKTILIVEDEVEIADALVYVLKSEGMNTLWVNTAQSALAQFEDNHIDLAILDVGLPDASGFDLFKSIRENHHIPMMFLTARAEEIDRIVGLEIGADDYVTKPFSPREVAIRVKNIIKRSSSSHSNTEKISASESDAKTADHGFSIDTQKHQIHYLSISLDLTRSEYLLLSTFIHAPTQIFSRRQLIEAVWSTQHPSDDRVIDTHIKSLRHKLKRINPESVLITTHRGFGYSLLS